MADKIRVLYVDDESGLLDIGKLFLERYGDFTVTTALSAQEAILLLEQEKYDAIVSDYQMPGMNGIEFLIEVRKRFGHIPFILFTGRGREEVVIQAINSGADFYLQKGGDPKAQFAELSHKIKSAALQKGTDDALRLFKDLVEHSTDAIGMSTPAGSHYYQNEAFTRLFGNIGNYPPETVYVDKAIGKEVFDTIMGGRNWQSEVKMYKADKTIADIFQRAYAIKDHDGHIIGLVGLHTDITERKVADEALKNEQDFTHLLLNTIPAFFVAIGADGKTITMNQSLADALEYTPDEINGADYLTSFVLEEDREKLAGVIRDIVFDGKKTLNENRIVSKSGKVYLVEWYGRPVKHEDKKLDFFVGVGIDITERKRVEEALRESEDQSRILLSTMPDIVMVHQNGIIVYANQTAIEKTGFSREELIGSHLLDRVVPEFREIILRNMERRAAGEQVGDYEADMIHKSGALRHVIVRTSPIVFNGLPSVVMILIDITERKQAEVALMESEDLYRTIFETTGAATIIIENDTTIIRANAGFATLSGFSTDELEGKKSWTEFVIPADLEQMKQYHIDRRNNPSGETRVYEFRFVNRHGEIRYCINNVSVIPGTTRSVASVVDITDRKQAEDALEKRLVALTQPLKDTDIAFEDLFNIEEIQRLQDEFAKATGVASVITRTDGTPITKPSNFTHLCNDIIRKTERGCTNCYKSDAVIGRPHPGGPIVQPCLSGGLWDAGASIVIGGRHIANWLIGQVRNEAQSEDAMRAYAREIGVDEKTVLEAFYEVPSMSYEKLEAIAKSLYTLANQLSKSAYQNVQQARFITERKQAEEQALLAGEEWGRTFDAVPDLISILDTHHTILRVNKAMADKLGMTPEEAVGLTCYEHVHGTQCPPDFCPHAMLLKDQQEHNVEIHEDRLGGDFLVTCTPLLDKGGQLLGSVHIARDITERKKAEEALKVSEERFRNVIDATGEYVFEINAHGVITFLSDRVKDILGYEPQEMIGKTPVTIQITIFFPWLYEPGSLKYASKPADRYTRRDLYYIT